MKHYTAEEKENQTQAKSLLAEITGSPSIALPRRETIVAWLEAYLLRSDRRGYVMGETEGADLNDLGVYLRSNGIDALPA